MSIKEHGSVAAEWFRRRRPKLEERIYGQIEIWPWRHGDGAD